MPHFDWSVNFGNILTLAGFIFALYKMHMGTINRETRMHQDNIRVLTEIKTKIETMWTWFTLHQIGNHHED